MNRLTSLGSVGLPEEQILDWTCPSGKAA
jgi:hypothetical protein